MMSHSIVVSAVVTIFGIIAGALVLIVALGALGCVVVAAGKVLSALERVLRAHPSRELPLL